MKEETVRRVMTKYYASKGIKVVPSRGAGPDLLINGRAVEVKGSKYDFERMLKQLMDYAYKYSEVALALPFDGLNLKKAQQLTGLVLLIADARDIRLKVYLIAPHPKYENRFYVREFKQASIIPSCMTIPTPSALGLVYETPDSTKDKAVENLLKYSPVEVLRKNVCLDYLPQWVSQVQI